MSFWAEDMLMPSRNKFEQDGKKAVDTLVGDGKGVKGKYYMKLLIFYHLISAKKKKHCLKPVYKKPVSVLIKQITVNV